MRTTRKPRFKRQQWTKGRVSYRGWRHPRGIDSRQRGGMKCLGAHPRAGWATAKATRGLHPTGVKEVMVRTMADLAAVGEGMAARLYSNLSKRKKDAIRKKAEEKKVKVLN
jgi:large subunit ribosomal protein L32e